MSADPVTTDEEIIDAVAPPSDVRWHDLFAMPMWSDPTTAGDGEVAELIDRLYGLDVVVPFDWTEWYSPDRFPAGRGLAAAPVADAVRVLTSFVRGERFSDGAVIDGITTGSIPAAIDRLWQWYRDSVAGDAPFVDRAEYSDDGVYRWTYERRWAPGATMCWVGLNPGTGDSDHGPRPTLRRVVSWATREGCGAVEVVNLFSFRSTDPDALRTTEVDIIGARTDAVIREASQRARVTLAAWGGDRAIGGRSDEVLALLRDPVCAGTTKKGQPRHPLFVPELTPLVAYPPRLDDGQLPTDSGRRA